MRLTFLYQMYDMEAEATHAPIITEYRDAPAIRAFTAVLANKNTLPGQHPINFVLRKIGAQDEETGIIDGLKNPLTIATGAAWLAQQETLNDGN